MKPTRELIDDIERDRFERARTMSRGDRLLEGPRLFDLACRWMEAGLRTKHPDASDEQIFALMERRLQMQREMDDDPVVPVGFNDGE